MNFHKNVSTASPLIHVYPLYQVHLELGLGGSDFKPGENPYISQIQFESTCHFHTFVKTAQEVHKLSFSNLKAQFTICHPRRYMINFILKFRRSIFQSSIYTVSIICRQEWYNIITGAWQIIDVYESKAVL